MNFILTCTSASDFHIPNANKIIALIMVLFDEITFIISFTTHKLISVIIIISTVGSNEGLVELTNGVANLTTVMTTKDQP